MSRRRSGSDTFDRSRPDTFDRSGSDPFSRSRPDTFDDSFGDLDVRVIPGPELAPPPSDPPGRARRYAPTVLGPPALLVPLLLGAVVAVGLGVYGRLHTPTGIAVNVAGFSSPLTVKVWLGTGAAFFAVLQLLSALAMWGRLGSFSPSWAGTVHRWSGRLAFLLAIPVAVHCLYALGFASYDLRSLVHSAVGCFFFGAFTTKMFALPKSGLPGWVLPVLGGVVFTALIGVWLTSSVWYFTTFGVHL